MQALQQCCTLAHTKDILKSEKPILEEAKNKENNITFIRYTFAVMLFLGRLYYTDLDGVVATCYGLERPGIESRRRRSFPYPSRPALSPPNLLYDGHVGPFSGKRGRSVVIQPIHI